MASSGRLDLSSQGLTTLILSGEDVLGNERLKLRGNPLGRVPEAVRGLMRSSACRTVLANWAACAS